MTNSGILSTQWSAAYPTAAWVFRWTSAYISPGKSKVSWTLRTEGRDSSPKMLWSHCTLYINNEEKAKFGEDGWYYDGRDRASGSFECSHNDSGEASFTVKMVGRTYEGNGNTNTETYETFALNTNYPYTNCSNPSVVSISPSIQIPGEKFTISWRGAENGTANPIIEYKVQYKLNNGEWQDAGTVTGSSINITTPDNRGATITAQVKSIGKVGSNYSPPVFQSITDGSSCKINQLPPQIGSVTLRSTPASDDEWCTIDLTTSTMTDGDNTALKYQYKSGNDWLDFVPPFGGYIKELESGKTIEYEFRLYDGLEGGAPISCEVTKNIKPSSTMTVNRTENVAAEQTITLESTKTGDSILFDYACEYNGKQYKLTSGVTENTYVISDIRSFLFNKLKENNEEFNYSSNETYIYKLQGRVYDGIEYGDWNSTQLSFTTPKLQLYTPEEYSATNPNYFEDYVDVVLEFDDDNIDKGGTYTISGLTEQNKIDLSYIGRGELVKSISFEEDFSIKPSNDIYRVKQISLKNNFETVPQIIKPRSVSNIEFICSSNKQDSSEYGLGDKKIPKVCLKKDNKSIELTPSGSSSDNTWKFSISGLNFWNFFSDVKTYKNGKFSFCFDIENEFGGKFEEDFNLNINFDEQAVLLNNAIIFYPGENFPGFENWSFLKEGMPIYYNFILYAYDKPQVRFEIEGQTGWSKKFEPAIISEPSQAEGELEFFDKLGYKLNDKYYNVKPTKYMFSSRVGNYLIPEIYKDNEVTFKLFAKTNGYELEIAPDKYSKLNVKAHRKPTAYFNEVKFYPDLNGKINVLQSKITISDSGYSDEGNQTENVGQTKIIGIKIYGDNGDFDYPPSKEENSTYSWENFPNKNPQNWEFLRIAPKITSTLKATFSYGTALDHTRGEDFEVTKSIEDFSYFVIYNIIPTMAYRKNSVAINTGELDNYTDGAFVVKTHTDKNIVYFLSTKYETPEYNIHTINLDEGSMHNFIFDCGSWTNLPGGMTQSIGIGVSRGFADIAHSGEVVDLEQDNTTTIIISGGNAFN